VGVGWMVEEFDALGANFRERGAVADEQLEIVSRLWEEDKPSFEGRYYRFGEIGFSPKPMQRPRILIWIGGEGPRAQRRAARYGDAWFPYFVRITPRELAARVRQRPAVGRRGRARSRGGPARLLSAGRADARASATAGRSSEG